MAENSSKHRVLIVGAGIGGLVLAQCLRKQSIPFDVFERDDGPAARSGWAIGIHTLLDELVSSVPNDLPPFEDSVNHLTPLNLQVQLSLYLKDGRRVVQSTPESRIVRANRLRLRTWLSDRIPIQWGKRLLRVEEVDDKVKLHFEDGTQATGDILVGADGVNSVVREHVLRRPNKETLNTIPATMIIGETTLSGERFERQLSLGHSCYAKSAVDASYFLFVGLSQTSQNGTNGQYYWFVVRKDDEAGKEDHWLRSASQLEKLEHALKLTSPLDPRFTEIIRETPESGILKHSQVLRDIEIDELPTGRITLLGDAAHTMTPFRGEGGVHAIRDALNLGKALGQLNSNECSEIKSLLGLYQEEMLERGVLAVRGSRNAQKVNSGEDGDARVWNRAPVEAPEENILLKDCLPGYVYT
ncbi:putative monooxygenase [Annulohypoxylon maeteangense]|uniref:putative monooxygenase n=1 Tax=Annulohypoxylon maeteangense TaxID=1927788 RepID=UPI0020073887|nr:putative monooxygenase [Annulohypoxylon maeteangense]KAI0886985.1 putative monooxygenase [Annulohypoxylon maeteangense]